ncbi:MAG: hypothetical protein QG577_118 [Thermodesulfobacteriota bacterium]|nr:hypothetical protein [Thermodesulfobacteriota bacterium]
MHDRSLSGRKNSTKTKKVKVCYVAGREAAYSRTRTMIRGLQMAGFEVVPCLPRDKSFCHYPRILWDFLKKKRGCDLVVVGFYGQLLLPLVWALTGKPILFDLYITTYGTMVHDREKAREGSLLARVFWLSDKLSMTLARNILIETRHHIRGYAKTYGIAEDKFRQVFLALDESVVRPRPGIEEKGQFLVHFHGEYAPFHGVKYILQAAHLLRDERISFQIIGKGITWDADMRLARELGLKNCRFIDRVPYEALGDFMSRAHVCLGFFGENPRTTRVLTNKVIEALAAARPLITARNPSVEELLEDGVSAILVKRADPEAIAAAIGRLMKDPELRKRMARAGHEVFLKNCTLGVFSKRLGGIVREALA